MERKLSLEQRTERLMQRSQALLRPRPRGPEGAKALLGSAPCSSTLDDRLVQWRLGRCRGEEPALDTPLVGRALPGSTLDDRLVQWRLGRCRGEEPALDTPPVGRALPGSTLDDRLVQWRLGRCRGERPALDTPLAGRALPGSTLDDRLIQWSLGRCRGEEPALDTPLVGRALPGSTLDDRLVQWRLGRCREERPALDTPLVGRALPGSTLDERLVQWRLGRCRGERPALDTPLAGRALPGSAAPRVSLQEAPPGSSPDPPEAPWPIGSHLCKHQGAASPQAASQEPLRQDPCWSPPDSRETLWPMRSSSLDTLQGALYSQSRDSHHALRQISSNCCAPVHQGAPRGKRDSHEPLLQEPFWGSHDCLGALRCAPYWKSRGSQDALGPAREALPEPPPQGGPGLRSREAPQPIRSSARDALEEAPWQQPLAPLGDPLLWMLRCHRRAVRGRLRAIETLLECPPGHPQPMVGPIKQ